MSDTLHRMKVIIEANNAKLKQAMREATSVVNNTVSQMNTSTQKSKHRAVRQVPNCRRR